VSRRGSVLSFADASPRHVLTIRCMVRNCQSANCPGYFRCRQSKSVFASSPGLKSNFTLSSFRTPTNGSYRVRQIRSFFISLGRLPLRTYFRAIFSSIPAFAAADMHSQRIDSFEERNDIFYRCRGLYVVHGSAHISTPFCQHSHIVLRFLLHLIRCTERESVLWIHSASPE
jgi:hypothetical protein